MLSIKVGILLLCYTVFGQGQDCLEGFPLVIGNNCTYDTELETNTCPFQGRECNSGVTSERRLFPSMKITCNGWLTDFLVAGVTTTGRGTTYPELEIWRPNDSVFYKEQTFSLNNSCQFQSPNRNVQQCTITNAISVRTDDIIGIILPRNHKQNAAFRIHFLNSSQLSYILSVSTSSFSLSSAPVSTSSYRPMISLIISRPTPSSTDPAGDPMTTDPIIDPTTQPTINSINDPSTQAPTTEKMPDTPTIKLTPENSQTETITTKPTGVQRITSPSSEKPATTAIPRNSDSSVSSFAGPIAGVIVVVLVFLIGVFVLVVVILWRCKKSGYSANKFRSHIDNLKRTNTSVNRASSESLLLPLDNINYCDDVNWVSEYCQIKESPVDEDDYHYATVDTSKRVSSIPQPAAPSTTASLVYESVPAGVTGHKSVHSEGEWGLIVPSQEQRNKLSTSSCQDIYSYSTISQYSLAGPDPEFFEECETYWAPSSVPKKLYKQLSERKYREILRPQIQIGKFLGSGAFGTVSQGVWQSPGGGIEVAVKTNQSKEEEDKIKFLQEAAIMGQFRHPNVVKLMGVVTVGEPVMIVLELLSNGDLRNFLIKMQPEPGEMVPSNTPKQLLKFCQEICCGMEYLARKSFIHRDLAARNILLSDEKECKISDFGMSRDLMDESYYVSHGGKIPVKWTAPEALNFKKYSTASDVWSFGCVMYEIWSLGHKPFEKNSNPETLRMVEKGVRLPPPPGCPREVYKLMLECWHPETGRRPSFAQLVEMHSQANFELLSWRESDTETGPQVNVVGAPLEAAKNLYSDLQNVYLDH